MQKKIVALAVAGLSTAAFAQTNVTIYGVADVSVQGISASQGKATQDAAGNVMGLQSNSSLMGFKGTEDLGNGLKALFQAETSVNMAGNTGNNSQTNEGSAVGVNNTSIFGGAMRDTFVGLNTKYGTALAGYLSTPYRSALVSFAVEPGATGSMTIEKQMSAMRFGYDNTQFQSSVRATAIAYAMPTLYGFDGSIAYTGSNNNGNNEANASTGNNSLYSALSTQIGWTGYGVNIKGAFQQANMQVSPSSATSAVAGANQIGDYTSYLVGAMYTGVQNLKLSTVYVRNSLGTNGTTDLTTGAGKISNNQLYAGVSYRMGNWEPRVSATWSSDMDGSSVQQLGSRQWTANVGYYLSKRTQVYGLVSNLNNSANQNYTFGQQTSTLGASSSTSGSNLFTYGMGMRTSF